jgi:hypothetical protein
MEILDAPPGESTPALDKLVLMRRPAPLAPLLLVLLLLSTPGDAPPPSPLDLRLSVPFPSRFDDATGGGNALGTALGGISEGTGTFLSPRPFNADARKTTDSGIGAATVACGVVPAGCRCRGEDARSILVGDGALELGPPALASGSRAPGGRVERRRLGSG